MLYRTRVSLLTFYFFLLGIMSGHPTTVRASSDSFLGKLIVGAVLWGLKGVDSKSIYRYGTNRTDVDVYEGYDVIPSEEEKVVVVGKYGEGSFVAEFEVLEQEFFGYDFSDTYFEHVIQTSRGDFFMAGKSFQTLYNSTLPQSILTKFEIDIDNGEDPFRLHWTRTASFALDKEINALIEADEGSVVIAGTAYGALVDNSSFPRIFALKYSEQGILKWGLLLSSAEKWDKVYSVTHDQSRVMSMAGWSLYGAGEENFLPAMYLVNLNDTGEEGEVNWMHLFLIGNRSTGALATSKGMIGFSHIQTSSGDYVLTGVKVFYDAEENRTSTYFLAAKVTSEGIPLWFHQMEGFDLSAGYKVAEAYDGDYLFLGIYGKNESEHDTFLMKLSPKRGLVTKAINLSYNESKIFSMSVRQDGHIWGVGRVQFNNTLGEELLLGSWDRDMENIGDSFEPKMKNIPLILLSRANSEEVETPLFYLFQDTPSLSVGGDFYTEEFGILEEVNGEEKDYRVLKIASIAVGGVLSLYFSACCCGFLAKGICKWANHQ